jgi:type III restriction enzyme
MTEIKVNDLVLQVTKSINPDKLDLGKYEDFLDELCGHREFQKEAIRTVIRFMLSGEYTDTADLARTNFDKNVKLKELYSDFDTFKNKLDFPDKLACTVDLATATGKSWVMYGVAQILLCEGVVDQVLVLCPSRTVKDELLKKFKKFVTDKNLRAALQNDSIKLQVIPSIIDASKTIKKWDICIDNIHKTYSNVTSSISNSLQGKGKRTLILNDECHHIMNPKAESSKTDTEAMKEWKKFLQDKRYNFRFIAGFSGTPYTGNEYARDVVYRYSIMQAMEGDLAGNFITKKIEYVQKAEAKKPEEKLEEIYANHQRNKKDWKRARKHITIFVTSTINNAEKLANTIKNFLVDKESIPIDEADKKVLVVTSNPKHEKNRITLKHADRGDTDDSKRVEWIVSVSMLTEGWDVDNVFQIVPHDERAFNSKLLIAQVLGRGLRVPVEYQSEQPTVIVYNHDNWSNAIKDLVYEVWDYEHRVRSYIVDKERDYNFEMHNLDYKKVEIATELHKRKGEYTLPKLPEFSTQHSIKKIGTVYYQIKENREREIVTKIRTKMYTVDQLLNDIVNKLAEFDDEAGTNYLKQFNADKLRRDVEVQLKKADPERTGQLTEENYNRIQKSYDVLSRVATKTTIIKRQAEKPFVISTRNFSMASAKVSEFNKNKSMIYEEDSVKASNKEDIGFIEEAENKATFENVIQTTKYSFKCPLNIVILSYSNENKFAKLLVENDYALHIDSWIKNVDRGTKENSYIIPYSYRAGSPSSLAKGGGHQKEANFFPDFILKIAEDILIIEIKSDEDVKEVNEKKLKYAKKHFAELNGKQTKYKYYFYFLSPLDFRTFFDSIKNKTYKNYVSNLEAELMGLVAT